MEYENCPTCREAYSWDTTKTNNMLLPVQSRCCSHLMCQGCVSLMTHCNDAMEEDFWTDDFDFDDDLDDGYLEDSPAVISCPICQQPNAFDAKNPIVSLSTCAFLKGRAGGGSPGTGIAQPPTPVVRVLQDQFDSLASKLPESIALSQLKSPVSRVRRADNQDEFGMRRKKQKITTPLRSPFGQDPPLRSPFISPITAASSNHFRSPFHGPTAYAKSTLTSTLSSLSIHP